MSKSFLQCWRCGTKERKLRYQTCSPCSSAIHELTLDEDVLDVHVYDSLGDEYDEFHKSGSWNWNIIK